MALTKEERRLRIKRRIRKIVSGTAERPRMSVYRSNAQISVQLIDDKAGKTLLSVSSLCKEIAEKIGMPWLIHNLFTTLFDGEDRQSYLGTLVFYGSVTFLNCMLTDRVCSQIPVEGIRELLERALVCLLVSNGIFLLCYGGRKDFRALLAMGKRFLPEIPHDKAASGNDRSAEETTKFADYGKVGAFYEDCSSGNRVCGIVHGSSAGPES